MYISALLCALGTPSEFSSVPILVADELVLPFLVHPDPRANTLHRTFLSPEQLPCNCDLAIRVTTTRNIDGVEAVGKNVVIARDAHVARDSGWCLIR